MTTDASRTRVPAGIPTGGEFAIGARTESGDLVIPDEMAREQHIAEILEESGGNARYRAEWLCELDGIECDLGTPIPRVHGYNGYRHYQATLTNPNTGKALLVPVGVDQKMPTDPDAALVLDEVLDMERERVDLGYTGEDFQPWTDNHDYYSDSPGGADDARKMWTAMAALPEFLGEDYNLYLNGERN